MPSFSSRVILCLCGNGNRGLHYVPELIFIATRLCVYLVIRAVLDRRVVFLIASKICTLLQIWKQSARNFALQS